MTERILSAEVVTSTLTGPFWPAIAAVGAWCVGYAPVETAASRTEVAITDNFMNISP
ncbi:MAG: hypothetical protein ACLRW2_07845 [Parasutterella excrementihominis]